MAQYKTRSPYQADVERLAQSGMKAPEIAKRLGIGVSTAYSLMPAGTKRQQKRRQQTLTIPLGSAPADPDGEAISISVSHDDFQKISMHPSVVAAQLQSDSLRTRVLRCIAEDGPVEDIQALIKSIRRPGNRADNFGQHEITHIVKALNGQGLVKYVESRGTVGIPTRIEATRQGFEAAGLQTYAREIGRQRDGAPQHAGDRTDFRTHGHRAEGGEVLHIEGGPQTPENVPSAPAPAPARKAPDLSDYPLLADLVSRDQAGAERRRRADAYLEAAATLAEVNPSESERLMALAEEETGAPFTSLEAEIVRFLSSK